ncbi:MAG: hypothetical protein MHM6MM_004888 [Cercozoa sp. M6MM]
MSVLARLGLSGIRADDMGSAVAAFVERGDHLTLSREEYKQVQEWWVSDTDGTSLFETVLVGALSVPLAVLVFAAVKNATPGLMQWAKTEWRRFLLEFAWLVTPLVLLFVRDLCTPSWAVSAVLWVLAAALIVYALSKQVVFDNDKAAIVAEFSKPRLHFLSQFRASLMLLTVTAILAVDFRVFPRRFAKTERFGFSPMDMGVGAFVFAGGLVSRQIRADGQPKTRRYFTQLRRNLSAALPMLVLGMLRFVVLHYVGYQQHVSEYGVHWNFFCTLAVVAILNAVIQPRRCLLWAVCCLALHQALLSAVGVSVLVEDKSLPRDTLFLANREGISSCLGFFALHCAAMTLGQHVQSLRLRTLRRGTQAVPEWRRLTRRLWQTALVLLLSAQGLHTTQLLPVSRKQCNLSYVLVVVGTSCAALAALLHTSLASRQRHASAHVRLFDSINRNSLVIFMLANFMTGAVNLSMRTVFVPPLPAATIIWLYVFLVCLLAHLLRHRTLKFW